MSPDRPSARPWRWNPRGVATLYLASTREGCRLEFLKLLERAGFRAEEALPRALTRFSVRLADVESLRSPEEFRKHRLRSDDMGSPDFARCQRVAAKLVKVGREGVLALAAVAAGETLAVFTAGLRPSSRVKPVGTDLQTRTDVW
jgi:RES domain-containing protein